MNERELLSSMKKKKKYASYLQDYTNMFTQLYHDYASIQLAFSYYTVYEILSEDADNTEWKQNLVNKLTTILDLDGEEAIDNIVSLRNEVTGFMNNITLYSDVLSIFEHILNRVEYRFKDCVKPDLDYVSTRIQQFIFADKDAVITNDKIKTIVSELPVRMTKQRFYDILSDSLDIYEGSDVSSVDSFLYMLRTIATLQSDLQPVSDLDGIDTFITRCNQTDFTKILEEEYNLLMNELQNYGEQLTDIVNIYMQVQECINHFYTIQLCKPYVSHSSTAGKNALDMVSHIKSHYYDTDSQLVLNGCNTYLEQLEGKQEDIMERVMGFEALLSDVALELETNQDSNSAIDALLICEKLVSTSMFIDLEADSDNTIADNSYIKTAKEQLIADFSAFFTSHSQLVNRAVMSAVLGAVPVFFKNTEEIVQYINYALEHCSDLSELCACVEIINQIME